MLQKLSCILLALLLLLGLSGCGKKDISSDIPELKNAVPGENKSNLQMETIEDKFTMLLEVYDILSSPLGKPYCTKEYWGGEEIDILKADNDYLIGLRNFENQMHYLFYCKSKHSITEIDTLDKHVPWEDICFDKENQAILFSYPVVKEKKAAHGKIAYLIPDNSYTYIDPDVFYDAKLEDLFQIPKAGVEPDLDFQFLLQAHHNLQSLYFTNLSVWDSLSKTIFVSFTNPNIK